MTIFELIFPTLNLSTSKSTAVHWAAPTRFVDSAFPATYTLVHIVGKGIRYLASPRIVKTHLTICFGRRRWRYR